MIALVPETDFGKLNTEIEKFEFGKTAHQRKGHIKGRRKVQISAS